MRWSNTRHLGTWGKTLTIALACAILAPALASAGWVYSGWRFRVPLEFNAGSVDRIRRPAEAQMNFTSLFGSLGSPGKFDPASLRVVEVNDAGETVADSVAFQFDRAVNYNDSTNAVGTLVVLMTGTTPSSATRKYHVYFDYAGQGMLPATVAPRVSMVDEIYDEGQYCYKVTNTMGTMYYQKIGAAFSSWVDNNGNDWVGYGDLFNSSAAGDGRGIPNCRYPEGYFHPGSSGNAGSISTITHQGPLKLTIHSILNSGRFECQWDIYPEYARMTMLYADSAYWVLYEGTPGGVLEPDVDFVTRSDGTQTMASVQWVADIPSQEWVYFSDPNVNRSLFAYHEEDDNIGDYYRPMTVTPPEFPLTGSMTVFGFGRTGTLAYMYAHPQHFVYGLIDGTQYSTCAPLVRSSAGDLAFSIGQPEEHAVTLASLLAPPNGATKQARNVRVSWSKYANAIGYRVQAAKDSLFGPFTVAVDGTTTDTSYAMSGLLPNTWYFWHVAAVMPTYTIPFNQPWKFQTVVSLPNQVKQVAPANGGYAQKDSVVCRWRKLGEATGYALEWTTDSTFAYPDADTSITDTLSRLSVPPGIMYWRVRAKNDAGWGPYSAVWKFNATLTEVRDRPTVASDYQLFQNFPNPFNPSTLIEYALPAGGRVSLVIFNTLGQTVATLIDEQQSAGVHTVVFEPATSLPSGTYFYRMSVNGYSQTKAMLLLR